MNHIVVRFACFACGVVVNSFAIALITKGDMGTSQISSVPYVLSIRFPLSFGAMTFVMNMLFIVLRGNVWRALWRAVASWGSAS